MARLETLRYDPDPCSIGRTLELIGEKWSLLVLREVFAGIRRFDDLQRRIGAPRQVLSARLSTLIAAGVLRRHPYQDPGRRTRYEYRLTTAGMDLYPVLVGLLRWGDRYLDQPTRRAEPGAHPPRLRRAGGPGGALPGRARPRLAAGGVAGARSGRPAARPRRPAGAAADRPPAHPRRHPEPVILHLPATTGTDVRFQRGQVQDHAGIRARLSGTAASGAR